MAPDFVTHQTWATRHDEEMTGVCQIALKSSTALIV